MIKYICLAAFLMLIFIVGTVTQDRYVVAGIIAGSGMLFVGIYPFVKDTLAIYQKVINDE